MYTVHCADPDGSLPMTWRGTLDKALSGICATMCTVHCYSACGLLLSLLSSLISIVTLCNVN